MAAVACSRFGGFFAEFTVVRSLVESHVRSLKSLGVSPDSYGTLLSSVLLNKLPLEIRLIASRKVDEDRWSLDALLKVVEEEIRVRERRQ